MPIFRISVFMHSFDFKLKDADIKKIKIKKNFIELIN